MMPTTMLIIAGVLALVATVLAFIYVVPEKRREKLGAFGKFLHDTCNFKYLMVEKILQALYIFTTAAVIIFGVLMLFRTEYNYWTGDRIWMGGYGLLIIILGPIAIRLSYELMMMAILLLKNVISINHKLADQTGKGSGDVFAAPNMQERHRRHKLRHRRHRASPPISAASAAPSWRTVSAPTAPPPRTVPRPTAHRLRNKSGKKRSTRPGASFFVQLTIT